MADRNAATQDRAQCGHDTLAETGIGNVQFCHDCQVFHLNLRAMTLRFAPGEFSALCWMLGQAWSRVQMEPHAEPACAADERGTGGVH